MYPRKNEIVIGVVTSLILGIEFLFLHVTDLTQYSFLRFFNGVFIAISVNEVIRINVEKERYGYSTNFLAGMRTAMITVMSCVLLLIGFFALFDVSEAVLSSAILPVSDQYQFAALVFIEGSSSAVIVTFCLMQYWKNKRYASRRGLYTKPHQLK